MSAEGRAEEGYGGLEDSDVLSVMEEKMKVERKKMKEQQGGQGRMKNSRRRRSKRRESIAEKGAGRKERKKKWRSFRSLESVGRRRGDVSLEKAGETEKLEKQWTVVDVEKSRRKRKQDGREAYKEE